jgi:tRNA(Glu) U13 pseudouridine synthase TruD
METDNVKHAVVVSFSLEPSQYATVALRELLAAP